MHAGGDYCDDSCVTDAKRLFMARDDLAVGYWAREAHQVLFADQLLESGLRQSIGHSCPGGGCLRSKLGGG